MEHQRNNQGSAVEKVPSKIVRALGVLVGLLFVAVPPMVALDKGGASVGEMGSYLLSGAMGLLFIGYGISGRTDWVKVPQKHLAFWCLIFGAAFITTGLAWILATDSGVFRRIIGAWFLLFGCNNVWSAYVRRRAKVAA